MISLERVKILLNDPTISDQEVELIRDGFRTLVEDIIFEKWIEERNKIKQKKYE